MELLLWRWSSIVQISSDIMIALFFLSLARSTQRVELRPWVNAWLANLAALTITVVYWLWNPDSAVVFSLVSAAYIYFKTLFVLLLLVGLSRFLKGQFKWLPAKKVGLISGVIAVIGGIALPNINWLGTFQSSLIFLGLGAGVIFALRSRSVVLGWIIVGFAARAGLAFAEAFSYALNATVPGGKVETVQLFLASHSSFDSAAEWCIALGCVLALYRTIQHELTSTCDNLVEVKNELQDLVDKDALTGLGNRRTLRHVLEKAKETGATILFFDLNNFKQINDRFGHTVGDECLQRFANALQASFRPDDHIIRYAGDEFVVIANEITPDLTQDRVEKTRSLLKDNKSSWPSIHFSVGTSYLDVNGEPDKALHEADEAMYRGKKSVT